jgi:hypothetical protein
MTLFSRVMMKTSLVNTFLVVWAGENAHAARTGAPTGQHRRRSRGSEVREDRGEEGKAHPRGARLLCRDGGCQTMMNRPREAPTAAARNGDAGDEPGCPASIPVEGRKRERRRTSWSARTCSGRPRMVASGGDHGGGYARAQRRRVEGEGARGEGKGRGRERRRQGGLIPSSRVGRWRPSPRRIDGRSSARHLLAAVKKTTPWGAGLGRGWLRLGFG